MKSFNLTLKQLDRQLMSRQQTKGWIRPKLGWIRTLRKALGMTTAQLAKKLNVNRSRVIRIEQDELENALTLRTLKEVAEALECEFVYAFVPKTSLQTTIQQQAEYVAHERIARTSHSMQLEDQGVTTDFQKQQIEELTKTLLSGTPKHLWEDI